MACETGGVKGKALAKGAGPHQSGSQVAGTVPAGQRMTGSGWGERNVPGQWVVGQTKA